MGGMWDAVAAPANPLVNTSGDGLWFALLGLFGVLLGAFISGGFNYWVAWRKERTDTARAEQRRHVDLRRGLEVGIDHPCRPGSMSGGVQC
jgi:hypothetical protein